MTYVAQQLASPLNSTTSDALRWAAWDYMAEGLPRSAFIADCAAAGVRANSAGNRWNEAKKNWQFAFED